MSAPLLSVTALSKRFPTSLRRDGRRLEVHAVSEVSLSIRRGEIFAVVGESGSGKTTLGRLILRLIEPSSGSIRFDGQELTGKSAREMQPVRRRMQIVFQDPFSSLNPYMEVGEALAEPLEIHRLGDRAAIARRVGELLDLVGLPRSAAGRFPHQFSGGQRQRIAIARALAARPDFIVADEAVSALDVSIQAQILNLIVDLRDELGLTILFISHDLGVVRHLADRIGVMYAGRLVETGPTVEVVDRPAHPYTAALVAAAPTLEARHGAAAKRLAGDPPSPLDPPPGCSFAARCPLSLPDCRTAQPPLRGLTEHRASACLRAEDQFAARPREAVHAA